MRAQVARIATVALWLIPAAMMTAQHTSTPSKSRPPRAPAARDAALGTGLIFYRFLADQPASYGEGVTSNQRGLDVNADADWMNDHNFALSLLGGFADSGDAVRQTTGRTANLALGPLYLAYGH